jgi:hypothetical protein
VWEATGFETSAKKMQIRKVCLGEITTGATTGATMKVQQDGKKLIYAGDLSQVNKTSNIKTKNLGFSFGLSLKILIQM